MKLSKSFLAALALSVFTPSAFAGETADMVMTVTGVGVLGGSVIATPILNTTAPNSKGVQGGLRVGRVVSTAAGAGLVGSRWAVRSSESSLSGGGGRVRTPELSMVMMSM